MPKRVEADRLASLAHHVAAIWLAATYSDWASISSSLQNKCAATPISCAVG